MFNFKKLFYVFPIPDYHQNNIENNKKSNKSAMGLDLTFVNPATLLEGDDNTGNYPSDYTETKCLHNRHPTLRVIDWLPYSSLRHKSLYPNIRTNSNKNVAEFKEWLIGLVEWILTNRKKYMYLLEPKYEWQAKLFNSPNREIAFGNIETIDSPTPPPKSDDRYLVPHHIYWTDTRHPTELSMLSDAYVVMSFITKLEEMNLPDDWELCFH